MTSKPVLWITRKLSDKTLERATRDYDAIINHEDGLHSADEIVEMSAKADAILPCHSELFSADVAARLDPRVKIIANHSVGVDHCNLDALKKKRNCRNEHAGCTLRCNRGDRLPTHAWGRSAGD